MRSENKRVPGEPSMTALAETFKAQKGFWWNSLGSCEALEPGKGLPWLQMNPFQPQKGRY